MVRRLLAASAIGMSSVVGGISPAGAAGSTPGIPGEPNCHGHSVAFVAQGGFGGGPGAGNAARYLGISVKEGQELTREFCG